MDRLQRPRHQTGGRAIREEGELDDEVIHLAMESIAVQLVAMTVERWMGIDMVRRQGVEDDLGRDRQREKAQESSGE